MLTNVSSPFVHHVCHGAAEVRLSDVVIHGFDLRGESLLGTWLFSVHQQRQTCGRNIPLKNVMLGNVDLTLLTKFRPVDVT